MTTIMVKQTADGTVTVLVLPHIITQAEADTVQRMLAALTGPAVKKTRLVRFQVNAQPQLN